MEKACFGFGRWHGVQKANLVNRLPFLAQENRAVFRSEFSLCQRCVQNATFSGGCKKKMAFLII